jgi:gas vesicle protein
MSQSGVPGSPGVAGEPKRRLFTKAPETASFADPRIEAMISASHHVMMERLEEGLEAIEETASSLMREVANEIWKATGGASEDVPTRLLERIGRDQTVRGLIAHSDERFQTLDVRIARIEESLDNVDKAAKALGELMESGRGADGSDTLGYLALEPRVAGVEETLGTVAQATAEVKAMLEAGVATKTPGEVEAIHTRLNAVQEYLTSLGSYLGERDKALVEWLRKRTGSGGASEAGFRVLLEDSERRLRDAVALHVQALHERVEQQARVFGEGLAEGLTVIEGKALARLDAHGERVEEFTQQIRGIRDASDAALERLTTVFEQKLTELTEQIWADALALRRDLQEQTSESGREALRDIDERLARVTELVNAALGWSVEQVHDHIERETLRSVEVGMADFIAALDRRFVDLDHTVSTRVERMDRTLQAGLGALEESFAERTADGVESAVERHLGPVAADLSTAVGELRVEAREVSVVRGEIAAVRGDVARELDGFRAELVAGIARTMDDRITQLARLIRSDNEALADRLEVLEEQAAAKEAIRAVNELAAALPGEISTALDQRLALVGDLIRKESRSTADVVAKVGGALADRIDRNSQRIGERFDREVETVVDSIGGTMASLATGLRGRSSRQ